MPFLIEKGFLGRRLRRVTCEEVADMEKSGSIKQIGSGFYQVKVMVADKPTKVTPIKIEEDIPAESSPAEDSAAESSAAEDPAPKPPTKRRKRTRKTSTQKD